MKRRAYRYSTYSLVIVLFLFFGVRSFLYHTLEEEAITTRPNGNDTPEMFGVPSQQFEFESNGHILKASLVEADQADGRTPAILLYHGRRETISRYADLQAMLYKQGITSMVFDYSGFGNSTGEPTIENLQYDAVAAWKYFTQNIADSTQPRIAMGHSLGTGILMSSVNQLEPQPDLVVLSAPWSTARDAVIHLGMVPEDIYYLLPDVWNNIEAARFMEPPLLVIHGSGDRVVPEHMGREVAEAGDGRFVSLPGIGHRALVRRPTPELWRSILEAVQMQK